MVIERLRVARGANKRLKQKWKWAARDQQARISGHMFFLQQEGIPEGIWIDRWNGKLNKAGIHVW
jgi:hypothetical protein